MKIKLSLAILLIISISISTLSKAQSVYKRKLENIQDTSASQYRSGVNSYNYYKFDKRHSIKANLISPFFNILSVFYTKYVNQETALQFGFSLMSDYKSSTGDENRILNAQAITIEYRYILSGTHANSTYIQPFTRFISANADANYNHQVYDPAKLQYVTKNYNYNESCVSAGIGFLLGVQNTIKNKLLFDLYAGPVYSIQMNTSSNRPTGVPEFSSRGGLQDLIVKGYGIRAGLAIGFLF